MRRAVAAVCAAAVLGCGGSAEPTSGGQPVSLEGGTGRATVTYQPSVKTMTRSAGLAALRAVSTDGSTLLLDPSAEGVGSLQPGDVLLIEGLLARRILAAEPRDGAVVLLTEQATLGETISDGRIELRTPVRFRGGARSAAATLPSRMPLAGLLYTDAHAQPLADEAGFAMRPIEGEFAGWQTTFSAVPGTGRLDLSIRLTKEVGGFRAVVTGDGYLADFELDTDIEVKKGVIERLQMASRRLNGTMNFRWEVGKETPGPQTGEDRIKLPAALSIPLAEMLGGLPLFLEISSAMIIQPAISGGSQYSRGAFRITWDGYQHFRIKEGNIDPEGNVTGDIQFLESRNISALAPMGMVVAFAAPRIELTFGTSRLVDMGNMAKAAERVDRIAEELVGRVLGPEALDRLKASPMGGFPLSKAVANAVASDAAAFVELVTSSGMSHSGMSAITPCTRTDMYLTVKVGASAQAFGQEVGKIGSEIFNRHATRIDPPGTRLCEQVGAGK